MSCTHVQRETGERDQGEGREEQGEGCADCLALVRALTCRTLLHLGPQSGSEKNLGGGTDALWASEVPTTLYLQAVLPPHPPSVPLSSAAAVLRRTATVHTVTAGEGTVSLAASANRWEWSRPLVADTSSDHAFAATDDPPPDDLAAFLARASLMVSLPRVYVTTTSSPHPQPLLASLQAIMQVGGVELIGGVASDGDHDDQSELSLLQLLQQGAPTHALAAHVQSNPLALSQRDSSGNTILHWASLLSRPDCLQLALTHSLSLSLALANEEQAQTHAQKQEHEQEQEQSAPRATRSLSLSLTPPTVHSVNNTGETPLHFAARASSRPCARLLLQAGADATGIADVASDLQFQRWLRAREGGIIEDDEGDDASSTDGLLVAPPAGQSSNLASLAREADGALAALRHLLRHIRSLRDTLSPAAGDTIVTTVGWPPVPLHVSTPPSRSAHDAHRATLAATLPMAALALRSPTLLLSLLSLSLLEAKVLYVSASPAVLSATVTAMRWLMEPFDSQVVVIGRLPAVLDVILEAPTPFLVGVHRGRPSFGGGGDDSFTRWLSDAVPDDVFVIDLDAYRDADVVMQRGSLGHGDDGDHRSSGSQSPRTGGALDGNAAGPAAALLRSILRRSDAPTSSPWQSAAIRFAAGAVATFARADPHALDPITGTPILPGRESIAREITPLFRTLVRGIPLGDGGGQGADEAVEFVARSTSSARYHSGGSLSTTPRTARRATDTVVSASDDSPVSSPRSLSTSITNTRRIFSDRSTSSLALSASSPPSSTSPGASGPFASRSPSVSLALCTDLTKTMAEPARLTVATALADTLHRALLRSLCLDVEHADLARHTLNDLTGEDGGGTVFLEDSFLAGVSDARSLPFLSRFVDTQPFRSHVETRLSSAGSDR